MALFNRRKDQTISDLEDYYANRNNRTGMAWLMAFLSLLITIAVVAALFFGGRWIYRTLTDDNTTVITTTSTTDTMEDMPMSTETATSSQTTGNSNPNPSTGVESAGVVSNQAASTSTPNTGRSVAGTSTTTPTTGDSDLPNTGTGEAIVLIPAFAAIAGFFYSRKRQLQK